MSHLNFGVVGIVESGAFPERGAMTRTCMRFRRTPPQPGRATTDPDAKGPKLIGYAAKRRGAPRTAPRASSGIQISVDLRTTAVAMARLSAWAPEERLRRPTWGGHGAKRARQRHGPPKTARLHERRVPRRVGSVGSTTQSARVEGGATRNVCTASPRSPSPSRRASMLLRWNGDASAARPQTLFHVLARSEALALHPRLPLEPRDSPQPHGQSWGNGGLCRALEHRRETGCLPHRGAKRQVARRCSMLRRASNAAFVARQAPPSSRAAFAQKTPPQRTTRMCGRLGQAVAPNPWTAETAGCTTPSATIVVHRVSWEEASSFKPV